MNTQSSSSQNLSRCTRLLPLAAALLGAFGLAGWLASADKSAPATPQEAVSRVPGTQMPQADDRRMSEKAAPASSPTPAPKLTDRAVPAPLPWRLAADARPRSHRQKDGHTSSRTPRRSARVEIADNWLTGAAPGGVVSFDLGAGLTVQGEYVTVRSQTMPGVDSWAGVLHSPPGVFQLEHHSRGWGGMFRISGSTEDILLMPDRHEPGMSRLEVWDRRDTVCASRDEDGNPATAPPADPSIDQNNLQSRPGAENCLYIDFNGETVSDTTWNHFHNSFNDIVAAPSGMTRDEIVAVWARSAEDWITFDVNVTTSRSVYNSYSWHSRAMIVCTPTKQWYTEGESGIGGVAQHDSFNNLVLSQICWCFNLEDYLECAETVSHEFGHMMGNSHSGWSPNGVADEFLGIVEDEYYGGYIADNYIRWAPIMGWSPDAGVDGLTQFSKGEYFGATNEEDQIDEIEYELDPIGDENSLLIPEGIAMSGSSKKVKGLMNSGGDIDSYIVDLPAGGWTVSVEPNACGPNIDCLVAVRRFPDNSLIGRKDNENGANQSLSASVNVPDAAGIYRINIGSDTLDSDPEAEGHYAGQYTNYGGIGTYTLRIKRPVGFETAPPVLSPPLVTGLKQGAPYADIEINFRDASEFERAFGSSPSVPVRLERISGGVTVTGIRRGENIYGINNTGDDTVYTVKRTYRFPAPGGRWDNAEAGSYRLSIGAGLTRDEWNNDSAAATPGVGTLAPDTAPPALTAKLRTTHVTGGTNEAVFVDLTATDTSPITVTANGTDCFEAISSTGAPPITLLRVSYRNATYQWNSVLLVPAPGGRWDDSEAGTWNIQVRSNKVRDSLGNITPPTVLGQFKVMSPIYFEDFEVNAGTTGFTFDTGWQHGSPTGSGTGMEDPADGSSGTRCIGYRLGAGGHGHYENNLTERTATSPLIDTTGHEGIVLRYRRWLKRHPGDGARIEINDASAGDAWTVIWNAPSSSSTSDRGWVSHEIPLPAAFANSAVQVRWVMGTTNDIDTAGGWNVDDFEILSTGTYRPGELVFALPTFFIISEGGTTASYTVRLNQLPFFPVTVNIFDGVDLNVNDTSLVFHSGNWSVPQTVVVSTVNDSTAEGNESVKIRHTCTTFDSTFSGVSRDVPLIIVDNDDPIIDRQPADIAVLPGASANLRVLPFDREIFTSVQWYEVVSGRRPEAISGATSTTLNVTLDAKKRGPQYYYARVTLRGITEESRTATLSELTGEPAFHARLLNKGYTTADISNPQFDNLDPDHNGLTHFAEYALGLLPGRAPRWQLGITPVPAESGQPGGTDLLVSLPALQPGVRYILQTSPDGQAWADFMVLESDPQDDSPPVIRVPGGENTKLLVRLKLSAIP